MKSLLIPVHSFVDVITNSSTTIFVNAQSWAIWMAKSLITDILKLGWSSKTAEDLFDIKYVFTQSYELSDFKDMSPEERESTYSEEEIRVMSNLIERIIAEHWELWRNHNCILEDDEVSVIKSLGSDREWNEYIYLSIVPKTKDAEDWIERFDFFDREASYDG